MMYQNESMSVTSGDLNHAVANVATAMPELHDHEFELFRSLIYRIAGINLSSGKKHLVSGRLAKRLKHHRLTSFKDYYHLAIAKHNSDELEMAVNLLTTHETHFFREPKHFDFLREQILPARNTGRTFRVWSAACSSGQEAYSIAMLLDDMLGNRSWETVGSDIDTHMVDSARSGQYPIDLAREIPSPYLTRYCLKGVGREAGTLKIDPALSRRVSFMQHNLTETPPPDIGSFDVIFLRNILIYFDNETKKLVISRLLPRLRSGGYLLIGHAESLNGISDLCRLVIPTVYRKP